MAKTFSTEFSPWGRLVGSGVSLADASDEALMEQVKHGNDDALAELFDRYHKLVYRIASRILRDEGEAEDLTQTVFLDIYRSIERFDARQGSAKNWVLQYTYHRSFNRKKFLTYRGFYQQSEVEFIENDLRIPVEGNAWRGLLPAETAEEVRRGLLQLNTMQRSTLEMIFFEGLKIDEIAERLGQTEGNIRHHYYRGLRKLRDILTQVIQPKRSSAC